MLGSVAAQAVCTCLRTAATCSELHGRTPRMKTKVVVLLAGGMVALLLLSRYFALSRAGLPLGWMLYLGLPITAAGVVFALRLINLGAGWSTRWTTRSAPAESMHVRGPAVRAVAVRASEATRGAARQRRDLRHRVQRTAPTHHRHHVSHAKCPAAKHFSKAIIPGRRRLSPAAPGSANAPLPRGRHRSRR